MPPIKLRPTPRKSKNSTAGKPNKAAISVAEKELAPDCGVLLLINGVVVGRARLQPNPSNPGMIMTKLHGHDLDCGEVAIYEAAIKDECEDQLYPYRYDGQEEPPTTIGEMHRSGIYAWGINAMKTEPNSSVVPVKCVSTAPAAPESPALPNWGATDIDIDRITPEGPKDVRYVIGSSEEIDREMGDIGKGGTTVDVKSVAKKTSSVEMAVLNTRKFNPIAYNTEMLDVPLHLIQIPSETLRDVKEMHKTDLKKEFEKPYGFRLECGTMSVTIRLKELNVTLAEAVKDGKVFVTAVLLDGVHRLLALQEVIKEKPTLAETYEMLRLSVWLRVDGQDIDAFEVLSIGSYLNAHAEKVAKMSLYDEIYACRSFINNYRKLTTVREVGKKKRILSQRSIASELLTMKIIHTDSFSSCRRFVSVLFAIGNSPSVWALLRDLVDDNPTVTIYHICQPPLFRLEAIEMIHCMSGLASYVTHIARNPNIKILPFKEARSGLTEAAMALYGDIRNVSQKCKVPVSVMFQDVISMTKTTREVVSKAFRNVLCGFSTRSFYSRKGVLLRRLREHYLPTLVDEDKSDGLKNILVSSAPVAASTVDPAPAAVHADALYVGKVASTASNEPVRRSKRGVKIVRKYSDDPPSKKMKSDMSTAVVLSNRAARITARNVTRAKGTLATAHSPGHRAKKQEHPRPGNKFRAQKSTMTPILSLMITSHRSCLSMQKKSLITRA